MAMPRLYVPSMSAGAQRAVLSKDETHHVTRVLRLASGAPVRIFDGRGREWSGRLESGPTRAESSVIVEAETRPVLEPEVAVIHIGAVKFPITGPLPYTMDAAAAVELIGILSAGVVVPVHVEGWSHFSQPEEAARRVFDAAPTSVRDRIRWLPLGEPTELG